MKMKVILLSDVKNVGKKDEVVEVAHGYAMNFLIKNKLAVQATKTSMDILSSQQSVAKEKQEAERLKAIEIQAKLESIEVKVPVKVGSDGRVFGSVSVKQVVDQMKKQHGIELDKRKIIHNDSMNTLGYHQLTVQLFKGVDGHVKVHVVAQ